MARRYSGGMQIDDHVSTNSNGGSVFTLSPITSHFTPFSELHVGGPGAVRERRSSVQSPLPGSPSMLSESKKALLRLRRPSFRTVVTRKKWIKLHVRERPPNVRSGHTAFFYNGKMYVFGGYGQNTWYNDLFELNFETLTWNEISKDPDQEKPCRRLAHTTVLLDDKVYMFGGWEENDKQLNDVWEYNIDTDRWKEIHVHPLSEVPSPRFRHSCVMWAKAKKMYVFGGYDWVQHMMLNDLFEFDMVTKRWKRIFYKGSISPRERHAATIDEEAKKMYIFGGFDGKRFLNDLLQFDLETHEFKNLTKLYTGDIPRGVRSHTLNFNRCSSNRSLILFAGRNELDTDSNDFFELDLDTVKWKQISHEQQTAPEIRGRHTAVMDERHGALIVFGGTHSKTWYNDVYVYHIGTYHRDIRQMFKDEK